MKNLLVVVDAQNDFIDGALGTSEARKVVPNIKDMTKSNRNIKNMLFIKS